MGHGFAKMLLIPQRHLIPKSSYLVSIQNTPLKSKSGSWLYSGVLSLLLARRLATGPGKDRHQPVGSVNQVHIIVTVSTELMEGIYY
jgi:hypothetical protein